MITKPNLETKKPVGNGVSAPQYAGESHIAKVMTASTDQSTSINGTYDHANLSAQFKNPRVKQDVPSAGENQYL